MFSSLETLIVVYSSLWSVPKQFCRQRRVRHSITDRHMCKLLKEIFSRVSEFEVGQGISAISVYYVRVAMLYGRSPSHSCDPNACHYTPPPLCVCVRVHMCTYVNMQRPRVNLKVII